MASPGPCVAAALTLLKTSTQCLEGILVRSEVTRDVGVVHYTVQNSAWRSTESYRCQTVQQGLVATADREQSWKK